MTSREAIFAALFARVSGASGFVTTSRALKHWNDVKPDQQPALFQLESDQLGESAYRKPTKWTFRAELYVYVHQQNTSGDVVSLLNTQVDAVVATLEPSPATNDQTLGGLVTDCRIDGAIETSEGRLEKQAVAIIPLLITVNR